MEQEKPLASGGHEKEARYDKGRGDRFRRRVEAGSGDSGRVPADGVCVNGEASIAGDYQSVVDRCATGAAYGTSISVSGESFNAGAGECCSKGRSASGLIAAAIAILLPVFAHAAGGNPISQAAGQAVDIGTALGALACAGGVMGAAAGGLMRNGGILAAGATTAVCGGAWAGAPQVVTQVIGGGVGGFGLHDLAASPPVTLLSMLFN